MGWTRHSSTPTGSPLPVHRPGEVGAHRGDVGDGSPLPGDLDTHLLVGRQSADAEPLRESANRNGVTGWNGICA
jgi:hypothetical protein